MLDADAIRPVFQPLVDLDTGDPVGYEALARGPEGSALAQPDALFAAGHATGRLAELDWACRAAAARAALEHGFARPLRLFVNVEPRALGTPCPVHLEGLLARSNTELDVVVELTERALTSRPAELLQAVAEIRARGWAVALDDVGADVASLALMPLLRPDVIKLDLRLVQERPSVEIAAIATAVYAEHERTGAVIVAEGIETPAQLETARSLGATVGQGWHFARPGALSAPAAAPRRPLALAPRSPTPPQATPYEAVAQHRPVRTGDKRMLLAMTRHLEQEAASLGRCAVVASAFQDAERFTARTQERYARLASEAAFVAALGVGMAPEPVAGVRGAWLDPDDPLRGEWSVVVLGAHFAAALVTVDLGDTGPDLARRFSFALTYDRDLVVDAACALMTRIAPVASGP